jgi:hypothetical protein
MATVLKRQQSLTTAFTTRAGIGLLCIASGVLIILVVTRFALLDGLFIIVVASVFPSALRRRSRRRKNYETTSYSRMNIAR